MLKFLEELVLDKEQEAPLQVSASNLEANLAESFYHRIPHDVRLLIWVSLEFALFCVLFCFVFFVSSSFFR
jgi:hypothetical protein